MTIRYKATFKSSQAQFNLSLKNFMTDLNELIRQQHK